MQFIRFRSFFKAMFGEAIRMFAGLDFRACHEPSSDPSSEDADFVELGLKDRASLFGILQPVTEDDHLCLECALLANEHDLDLVKRGAPRAYTQKYIFNASGSTSSISTIFTQLIIHSMLKYSF